MFSGGFVAASFILLFLCIMLPLFYIVFYVFKKNFNLVLMLIGLAAFFLFGYLLTGLLTGTFAPSRLIGTVPPAAYAIRRSLVVGLVRALSIWLVLLLLAKRYGSVIVPASFAAGYSLIDMLFVRGATGYIAFSQALAVNQNGIDYVVSTADLTSQEALRESLLELAQKPASLYVWGTLDSVCAFVGTICLARLLWYSIEGGVREENKLLVPVCLAAAVLLEIPGALYDGGAFSGYAPAGIIYYVVTALLVAGTIIAAKNHDEKVGVAASRLRRRGR